MKILTIFAHPPGESFNKAILNAFCDGAEKAGHTIDLIDLYVEKFNPLLVDTNPQAKLAPDVLAHQQRIKEADMLAFIFPTFWYRAPAILEGWFDRVLTSHFAYKYVPSWFGRKRPLGLLSDKKAVVIQTFGGPGWYYKIMTGNFPWFRFKSVLTFCGIKKIKYHPCWYVPFTTDKKREKCLKQLKRLGEKL